ncbi:MAG: amidase [Granulosicoccus sp.]
MISIEGQARLPDATALLNTLRQRKTTACELVGDHLGRLNALQPYANAAVKIYQKEALDIAAKLDASTHIDLPLFGLPFSVKETFSIAHEEMTAGSLRKRPVKCESDAEMVRRLKEAGAIIIARSNIPEFAMTGESTNPRFGRCNNHLDNTRVAGGSSGGEGVLVGSGSSAFGIGSDILGSIRIPAALCGTVGFKGHSSAIDGSGTWPDVTGNTNSWLGYGPLTRSVRDALLVYNVIAKQPVRDTNDIFEQVTTPEGFPITYQQECILKAINHARRCLLDNGVKSRHTEFKKIPSLFLLIPKIIIDDFYDTWISDLSSGPDGPFSTFKEFIAQLAGNGTIDSGLLSWIMLEPFMKSRRPGKREKIAEQFLLAKNEYRELLGSDTVLLLPTLGLVAPKHKYFNRQSLMNPRVNGLFTSHTLGNYLDLPSIAIPAWKYCDARTGLPASVSLMCLPGSEDRLFATAKMVETALN